MSKPNGSRCMDCNVNTSIIHEHFMLEPDLWAEVVDPSERFGMLCVGCVETRLGRVLEPLDFDPKWRELTKEPSALLLSRRGY